MNSWFAKAFNYLGSQDNDDNFARPKLEDFFSESSSLETKHFRGVVTTFSDSEGVINGDIYFSANVCKSNDISVGSAVSGEAQRTTIYDAWRATSISLEGDLWEDNNKPSGDEFSLIDGVIIGKVTALHEQLVCMSSYSFSVDRNNCSFLISEGDWLRCQIKKGDSLEKFTVLKIDPLRQKTIHGTISHFQGRNIVVNGEVLCGRSLLPDNVRIGSQIILDIIESDQGGFSWRAICTRHDPLTESTHDHPILPPKSMNYSAQQKQTIFPYSPEILEKILNQDQDKEKFWGIAINGTWKFSLLGSGHSDYAKITIKNESLSHRVLKNIWIHSNTSDAQLAVDDYTLSRLPHLIKGCSDYSLVVECNGKTPGESEESLVFDFDKVKIGRQISLSVGFAPLQIKKFKNKLVGPSTESGRIIQGEKPFHASHFIPMKLPQAAVPPELEILVLSRGNELEFSDCFIQPLNISNYQNKFSHLLYLEEIEMKRQMSRFAMPRVAFTPFDDKLALSVPGLAEKRPTLLIGDSVIASMPSSELEAEEEIENIIKYEGFVHEVHHSKVLLKFHREFHANYKGEDYAVSFRFNRTPLRRHHMAVSLVTSQLGSSILFPKDLKFQLPQTSYIDVELKPLSTNCVCEEQLNIKDKLSLKAIYINKKNHINPNDHFSRLKDNGPSECNTSLSGVEISSSVPESSVLPLSSHDTKCDNNAAPLGCIKPNSRLIRNTSPKAMRRSPSSPAETKGHLSLPSKVLPMDVIQRTLKNCQVKHKKSGSNNKGYFYYTPRVDLKKAASKCSQTSPMKKLEWKNHLLNHEQRSAVKRILEGSTRPLPYIILGPPGTGKTVTLVEAVLQVFLLIPHSRILIVAPSNSASDLVTIRLAEYDFITQADLIRLNSFNRAEESVPESIGKFCQTISNIDVAVHHRIIVCTASTSGCLYTARLKNGHFSHIFIDEAGQLTEPESSVPLGLVNNCSGQIILAGDPKQLGPVVMSSVAKQYGLGESLLSRLCSTALYQPEGMQKLYSDEVGTTPSSLQPKPVENRLPNGLKRDCLVYEPRLITLLLKSYRAHPDLLHIPSTLFYHSSLVSAASQEDCNYLLNWPELPNDSFPLLFHGVVGENQQEGDSPSWFNAAEVFQVARYAKSLLGHGVKEENIGIITPYRKQVEKIRRMLSLFEIEANIKVGTVEEFQGQERSAIILSTVRSSKDQIREDVLHDMGFVLSRQRFNVAVTRAKSLLVVIGNPFVLQMDCHWHAFITFCTERGGYVGVPLSQD